MFKANVYIEADVLVQLRQAVKATPKRMRTELGKIARGPSAQRLIGRLSREPGSPHYPLRWKSPKQRRAVMAMLRRRGNIPYTRTHALSRGWKVLLESSGQGEAGVFLVINTDRAARYVQGSDQQPYHIDTGWPAAEPIIREESAAFESDVIDVWYRVVQG